MGLMGVLWGGEERDTRRVGWGRGLSQLLLLMDID
jgi:hypothetical protein